MKKQISVLLLCLTAFAADAQILEPESADLEDEAVSSKPAKVSAEKKAMELLAHFQPSKSVVWLDAQGERFLGLALPAIKPKALGAVLLLHAQGQHPDWPGPLRQLRQDLPRLGWHTLAIALPDPKKPTPTKAAGADDNSSPDEVLDETEEIFDPTTDTVSDGTQLPADRRSNSKQQAADIFATERIIAAITHLKNQNHDVVVIYGQGLGALRAARYWQETGDNAVQALVLLDGQNAFDGNDFSLTDAISNPRMPVLDIINSRSLPTEMDAKQRAEHFLSIGAQAYRQEWYLAGEEQLTNMVYGFLKRHLSR